MWAARACCVARDPVACVGAGCSPQRRTCTGTCRRSDRNSQPQILMKRWRMCACFTAVRGIPQIKSEAGSHRVCEAADGAVRGLIGCCSGGRFERRMRWLRENYITVGGVHSKTVWSIGIIIICRTFSTLHIYRCQTEVSIPRLFFIINWIKRIIR